MLNASGKRATRPPTVPGKGTALGLALALAVPLRTAHPLHETHGHRPPRSRVKCIFIIAQKERYWFLLPRPGFAKMILASHQSLA
ncbi:hypothetical protein D623_10010895 [Myotis brandtii]|uniref:Uncharacterized protein n=1 Tax=Myotis brandtii TaxID=109478 RepID=S7P8X6_MYOBR|nr:hypothetical protein D623_10010895 [Myotis brandtii]